MSGFIDLVARLGIPVEVLTGIALLLAAVLVSVTGLRAWHQRAERRAWREGGRYVVIEVPPEVDPKSAVLAWRHLLAVEHGRWRRVWFGQPHLIWEYAFSGSRLSVRVWVPGGVATSLVMHAIDAAWPGAVCTVIDAEAPLPAAEAKRSVEGGMFALARHGAVGLPLVADAKSGEVLRGLIAAGVSHRPNDVAVVQIVARPASRHRVRRTAKAAAGPKPGGSLTGEVLDLFTPGSGSQRSGHYRPAEPSYVASHRKAVAERLATGALWTMRVRYAVAVSGPRPIAVAAARDLAAGTAAILGGAWRRRAFRHAASAINAWTGGSGVLVSADELAQVAHLPTDAIMPALARAGARPVAPVAEILGGGRSTKPLGTALPGGRKVALSAADARFHAHVIGSTGSGKSTLMLNMMLADIRDRRAVVAIDPNGDLIRDLLDRLDPAAVAGRVVIIDPDQDGTPPGLPPVKAAPDAEIAIDHLVGICRNIFEKHWGPRADDILRQSLRTQAALQQHELAGLASLPLLLTDKDKRAPLVTNIEHDTILRGFWSWFDNLPIGVQTQAVGPVLSRLRTILGRPFVRDVIGEPDDDAYFDLARALDHGGIILARLPKGQLGDDTARLMGSLLVARVWQTVTARQAQDSERRRDCSLYIDEAHNFLTLPQSIEDMLAEARKLRLSMVLAHQHMAQLGRELQFALSANARTKLYFATSPEDARLLARHTLPNLTEHDLAHLGAYQVACRTINAGRELPAFTLQTLPAPDPVGEAEAIRAHAVRFPAFTTGSRR